MSEVVTVIEEITVVSEDGTVEVVEVGVVGDPGPPGNPGPGYDLFTPEYDDDEIEGFTPNVPMFLDFNRLFLNGYGDDMHSLGWGYLTDGIDGPVLRGFAGFGLKSGDDMIVAADGNSLYLPQESAADDDEFLTVDDQGCVGHVTAATARQNLGLGDAATRDVGTGAGTVSAGNDPRFTDARTPTAHTHPQSDVDGLEAALAGKIPLSLIDAKGDLLVGSAADTAARLAAPGNDVSRLVPESAATAGLAWRQERLAVPVGNFFYTTVANSTGAGIPSTVGQGTAQIADIPGPMTVSEVRMGIAAGYTAGTNFRVSVYTMHADGTRPDALIADLGTIAVDSGGIKAITGLSLSLPGGPVWFCFTPQAGSAGAGAFRGGVPDPWKFSHTASAIAGGQMTSLYSTGFGTGAAPATFPAVTGWNGVIHVNLELKRSA